MIHPTAIIDASAQLDKTVQVGPYSIIGPQVSIGKDSTIGPHVVLKGPTQIGKNNQVFQFASIGEACQDKKYQGEPTQLIVGDDNVFREFTTIQRGTVQDLGKTQIGNRNLFMAYVHVAHDCIVLDDNIFANNATLAGHVKVGNGVILGGFSAVHQFCQLGDFSMTGMCSAVNKDIPAFVMVQGNMAKAYGLNVEGMKRRGYSKSLIQRLRQAYKLVYRQGLPLQETIEQLQSWPKQEPELKLFIQTLIDSTRGLIR